MRNHLLLTATALAIASTVAHAEPATRSDRAQIVSWARSFFADPYSLRSTEISDRAVINGVPVICVLFNAKNGYGAYAGVNDMPFEIRGDQLIPGNRSNRVNTDTCRSPQITMRPFPELAKIR